MKVLIADDEQGMRELVKRFLNHSRFTIIEAANGPDALAAVPDATKIDLLITDEMMPEMEGHELSRRLRLQNPDLKVLYLTGHSDHLFDKEVSLKHHGGVDEKYDFRPGVGLDDANVSSCRASGCLAAFAP